ncbi:hypothetical protein [Paenibacillus gallinarum]|uniref:Uncharacterized protein n=1 Tax=Paenibacillus gallinarum TaxID=2762232 RepID=A0ABR8T5Q4_9BACL|nr:hypothetical protein [Paenibacillus gallinarum]MBD7971096.1 hypothetical protein [Paenibacillus gallinarum]
MKDKKYLLFLIPLCIVAFGIFVYPTMYKYDKLEQKYPVMINRITGETKTLTDTGWTNANDYNIATEEMEEFKEQIMKEISLQRENIKNETIKTLYDEIDAIREKQDVINTTAVEVEEVDQEDEAPSLVEYLQEGEPETDPSDLEKGYFEIGDTKETVEQVMGKPDAISSYLNFETWMYELSLVKFKNGVLSEYDNMSDNLIME